MMDFAARARNAPGGAAGCVAGVRGRGFAARAGEDKRLVFGLTGPVGDPAHKEADVLLRRRRQTVEKMKQVF